ncbi:MAG TPA: cytochrome c3 family protein [Candidatus Binatia bacterium]
MNGRARSIVRLTLVVLLMGGAVLCRTDVAVGQAVLGDVPLKRTGTDSPGGRPTAVFPHWRHRLFFTCNVCHPAIFPMKGGETAVTMDDVQEGRFCGLCHNGKIAWGVSISACARCHTRQ